MNNVLKEIVDVFSNASPVVFTVLNGFAALITLASWIMVRRLDKALSAAERQRLQANTRLLQTIGEYLGNKSDNDVQTAVTDRQHVT